MKRIGFVVTKDQVSGSVSLPSAYATFIAHFGIPVPIFALDDHINTDIDLLILGGGADVDPIRYGQKPSYFAQNTNIQLEYFNTSSSKCILDVFKKLEAINKGGSAVVINWYYEEDDEDMLEAGEDYQAIISVPFKMVQIEE